jgi:hypothetical protein
MPKKKLARTTYIAEFNRAVGDNIRNVIRRLERRGYEVEKVPQLTTVKLKRPPGNTFEDFQEDVASVLQPRRGSAIIASSTGRAWSCNMKGNRPGEFVREF